MSLMSRDNLTALLIRLRAREISSLSSSDSQKNLAKFNFLLDEYLKDEFLIDNKNEDLFIKLALLYKIGKPDILPEEISYRLASFLKVPIIEFGDPTKIYESHIHFKMIYIWYRVWTDLMLPSFPRTIEHRKYIVNACEKMGLATLSQYVSNIK